MNASPHTILVIDDEMPMLIGLKGLLERSGYHAITCNNAPDGLKQAESNPPDLILCDIMMPRMDGFKLRERLSADPVTRDIPFLFLTARVGQTDKLKGFGLGAEDYLTKPFDPRELVARINVIFHRQDVHRRAAEREIAHQIERIQTEVSHNFVHELRTPMTQILMSLDMALREKYESPEELKWFVETALSQSQRLNFLIDDLVYLNNHDAGRSVNLRQKIQIDSDFLAPIELRQKGYEDKNLKVDIQVADGAVIHAPRKEFRQAISHLVDNGLKFAPPMTAVIVALEPNGIGGCILTVRDFGPGIPPELREKVFERYYQVSQGDTRKFRGLGVGLTIARLIAHALGGEVTILPSERGCEVQMMLPPAPLDIPL